MNKYTYIILALLISFVGFYVYYSSPEQQWKRIEEKYTDQIESQKTAIENLEKSIQTKTDQINSLSWEIQSDHASIKTKNEKIEKYNLCIKSKSMDCIKADKSAMLEIIPRTYATTDDETSEEVIKEKLLKEDPLSISTTEKKGEKIIELFANNPEDPRKECEWFLNEPKRIVLHYTATPYNLTAERILQSHLRKWNLDHYAGYHYIIDASGRIYNTRPDICNALAEPKANHDAIHISYIGDDKPNTDQKESLIWLVKYVSQKKSIDIKNITAHADVAPKNLKESMEYMFDGYETFQKDIRLTQTITRDGKKLDALTYAWHAWGDLDFILTIQKESQFNQEARGDIDRPSKWDFSFWYCQYNTNWQPLWLKEYKNLKSYKEQLNHCHEKYVYASTLPGGVWSRFHGFNDREKNKNRFSIQ